MDVVLPDLGEGIEKAVLACWHVQPGDKVDVDDDILEVVTDKATFHVSAGGRGILYEILVPAGKEARIGDVLARIEPDSA